jgi:sigma-E factor negative regulatory protein RseB
VKVLRFESGKSLFKSTPYPSLACLSPFLWAMLAINSVAAESLPLAAAATESGAASEARTINDWLIRTHEASKRLAYSGTFVVSSGGAMSSAKIWHVGEGNQQMERVETLSGAPRSTFRHNDQVVTFMPEQKLVRSETRESLGMFPELLQSADNRVADFYKVRQDGAERVAGLEADVVVLAPKDSMRFGYRVWVEQKRGLVVKLQTLDVSGKVLEQAAFTELQLDAPVKMDKLVQMMGKVDGYRVEKPALIKTTASAEGWSMKASVAGFKSMNCYKRPASVASGATRGEALQWIFSDGLASVSVFLEPFDRLRHDKESSLSMGATQTLSRQMGEFWLTVMGEVPMTTLRMFASNLERKK